MPPNAPDRPSPRLLTVVIAAFNAAETLGVQLEALARQTYAGKWEVVVSDNGSTDQTAAVAQSFSTRLPDLRVLDASDRKGAGHARNVGVWNARGDFIAACDADDEVADWWLAALAEGAQHFDLVGGPIVLGGLNEGLATRWRTSKVRDGLPSFLGFLPSAPGGNMGVWTTVVKRLGGWNESYLIGQDVEFSWRAQRLGCRIGLAEDALVRIRFRDSLSTLARQASSYGAAHARLYRDFRCDGLERSNTRTALRQWAWLAKHVTDLRSPTKRGTWLWVAGIRWGRLHGSIRYRVFYL